MNSSVASKLSPLMPYPGGQSREAKRLAKFIPKHDTYVEPFVGGGSFFFYKDPAKKEVIGDTSPWVIDFYKKAKKGDLRRCQNGFTATKSEFDRHSRSKTACSTLAKQAMSFAGKGKTFNTKQFANRKQIYKSKLSDGKLGLYEKRLKKATLVKSSFEKTMQKYDSSKTWHLLDPPWPKVATTRAYAQGQNGVTPEHVAKVGKKMKGIVWVLYNETPEVKKAFPKSQGWHIYRMSTRVSSGNGSVKYRKVLITNRPLKGKPENTNKLQGLGYDIEDIDSLDRLALSPSVCSFWGSIAAAGVLAIANKVWGDDDRTGGQIVADIIVGSSVFWMASQIATSVIDGLFGE